MFIQRGAARVLAPLLLTLALIAPGAAQAAVVEDYAGYQGQSKCSPRAKAGTKYLARWLVTKYGGRQGGISRACGGGASEHKEGRAFDWSLDAAKKADRKRARAFLADAFATDKKGNEHAKARRMGVMYIIWNDRMYPAWDRFDPKPYLSSSCPKKRKCSKTLRHRDHMHISLTRKGGKARTSWFQSRLAKD
ncbi:hypothetical protein [Nocardioides sp.]|uniref:hypothetical protein n=1 Tax=Nocardioides sp. TaxID=35761 RepID=UPI00356376A6